MRMPISGIYKIKGVGDVLAGRVEQGIVKPNEEVVFMPTHTGSNPCVGKVFTVEMHHKRAEKAEPGDNVGLNIKGLDKQNMPRGGDDLQEGRNPGPVWGVRRPDPGPRHSRRDQVRLLPHWLRALRSVGLPDREAEVEDGQGDWWKEDGGAPQSEVERDGRDHHGSPAAYCLRFLQEL